MFKHPFAASRYVRGLRAATLVAIGTLTLLLTAQAADARDRAGTYSGWSAAWHVDLDGDGATGFQSYVEGTDRFGRFSAQVVANDGAVTGLCGPTAVSIPSVAWSGVARYANGDLLFTALDSAQGGALCFDFVDGTFTGTLHATVTGGTGKFAGASGSRVLEFRGRQLLTDFAGNGARSAFEGTVRGEVILAKRRDD